MANGIETDVSDQAMITAIRANMADAFRHIARSSPGEQYIDETFARWWTGLAHPWFNGVLASQPPTDGGASFPGEAAKFFREKNIHTFSWWFEPPTAPSEWDALLRANGFGFSNDTPGMAVELAKMNVPKAVDGLDVQIIRDDAGLRVWANVFVNGYGLPPAWETSIYESWRHFGYDFPVRNYLGYLHGKPVSTSCLIFGGGAAGIYNVGTLPEARGRGLGAALTARPLLDARAMDYRIGTLQSSEMGFGVYQKLGFRHLCQIEYYFHANP